MGLLGTLTALGTGFVCWFTKDLKALDTLDFWVGTFLIFTLATIQIILFGWAFGIDQGWDELHRGADFRVPRFFRAVCPVVTVLFAWCVWQVLTQPAAEVERLHGADFETPDVERG